MECGYKIGSKEVFREANDNELRVTIYFPANCKYKCPFCTSNLPARSIRINAVLPSDPIVGAAAMPGVIRRWEKAFLQNQNIGLSFREDYNTVTLENLHALDTPYVCALTSMDLELVGQSDCHVCDNLIFRSDKGMKVRYHRGLANTRLKVGNLVEIESLVLFPDGHMATDWDRSDDGLAAYCQACGLQDWS